MTLEIRGVRATEVIDKLIEIFAYGEGNVVHAMTGSNGTDYFIVEIDTTSMEEPDWEMLEAALRADYQVQVNEYSGA